VINGKSIKLAAIIHLFPVDPAVAFVS